MGTTWAPGGRPKTEDSAHHTVVDAPNSRTDLRDRPLLRPRCGARARAQAASVDVEACRAACLAERAPVMDGPLDLNRQVDLVSEAHDLIEAYVIGVDREPSGFTHLRHGAAFPKAGCARIDAVEEGRDQVEAPLASRVVPTRRGCPQPSPGPDLGWPRAASAPIR